MDSMPLQDDGLGRFMLASTPRIRELLAAVAKDTQAPQDLQQKCQQYRQQEAVPWKLVQRACTDRRRHSDQGVAQESGPVVCEGSRLLFPSPPARQRSRQLQERLAALQDQVDEQRYAAMVSDVTHLEQQAAAALQDPFFPTTKLQLSFGLHVIITMGAFFALFYYAARFLLPQNPAWAALAGAVGLTAGMLLETTLLILRQNMPMPLEQKYAHLMDKQWQAGGQPAGKRMQQQQQQRRGGKASQSTRIEGQKQNVQKKQL